MIKPVKIYVPLPRPEWSPTWSETKLVAVVTSQEAVAAVKRLFPEATGPYTYGGAL